MRIVGCSLDISLTFGRLDNDFQIVIVFIYSVVLFEVFRFVVLVCVIVKVSIPTTHLIAIPVIISVSHLRQTFNYLLALALIFQFDLLFIFLRGGLGLRWLPEDILVFVAY